MMRSLRGRMLALSAVWITVALLAASLLIGGMLKRFVDDRFDAELHASAGLLEAGIDAAGPKLRVDDSQLDGRFRLARSGWYWQISAGRNIVARSPSLRGDRLRPPRRDFRHDGRREALRGPDGQPLRVIARRLPPGPNTPPLLLVVTAPARSIGASLHDLRAPLLWSLAAIGGGLALAVWIQLGSGLAGVRQLGSDLKAVRAGDAPRLPRPGISELDPLVDEINAALDQNATLLDRSRQHLGNLAHSLKTPLAALANELPPDHDGQALIARMDRLIGWHLKRARSAQPRVLGQRTPIRPVIDDILMVLRRPMDDAGITAQIRCADRMQFYGERADLEEMIGNLVENAVKYGRSNLHISVSPAGQCAEIAIEDDGPGIDGTKADRALMRGARLDENGPSGSGLGLAIVADLAALHGGALRLERSDLGGLRAVLSLPDDARAPHGGCSWQP